MGLQVWLPLTKDLRNQGLTNITVTNNGATYSSNGGKLGGCYVFDGSDDYINLGTALNNLIVGGSTPFSICFWVKSQENGTRGILFSSYGNSSTSEFFSLEINSGGVTNNSLRFDWRGTDVKYFANAVTYNQWVHLAVTYDGSTIKCYQNGTLFDSITYTLTTLTSSNTYYLGRDARTGDTALNGSMNDFRFYDTCLSAKEVNEIAQGLILHYPLNGCSTCLSTLRHMTEDTFTKIDCQYRGQSITTNKNWTSIALGNNSYNITLPSGTSGLTWFSGRHSTKLILDGYTGPFIISCEITSTIPIGFFYDISDCFSNEEEIKWSITANTKTYYEIYIPLVNKLNTNVNGSNYNGFVDWNICTETATGGTVTIENLKIYLLNRTEIEYDYSGFNNNGTKRNTFIYVKDAPKYNISTKFEGTGFSIVGNNSFSHLNVFTYNCWFKRSTAENAFLIMGYQYGNNSSGSLAIDYSGCAGFHYYIYNGGTGDTQFGSAINCNDNIWHMLTATYDGSKVITYLDGVKTAEKTVNLLIDSRTFVINYPSGSINNDEYRDYKGLLSDCRVYATALSATDVLSLYNNNALIDSSGKIHGQIRN